MTAPVCPVSSSQEPYYHSLFRGAGGDAPTTNSIPMAFDLASLLRTVNRTRDILRQKTTSLTVNNLYIPRPPNFKRKANRYYSSYPHWAEVRMEVAEGYVYHKDKDGTADPTQRTYVNRINRVYYENHTQVDPEFKWSYTKPIK